MSALRRKPRADGQTARTLAAVVNWRLLRELRGWSLREAATMAHIHPSVLSRMERGEKGLPPEPFLRLAQALHLSELVQDVQTTIIAGLKDRACDLEAAS